jgi:hypothetical protein
MASVLIHFFQTVLDGLMEEEQKVGFFLLKTDAIHQILTVLNGPSSARTKLADSIPSCLLDSYSTGEESLSLLAEILAEESRTESLGYEEGPGNSPPPSPNKDVIEADMQVVNNVELLKLRSGQVLSLALLHY